MQLFYNFTYNMLDLSNCKTFIPQTIQSNCPISTIAYYINDNRIETLDLTIMNKIFNIMSEDDFGNYEYNLCLLNLSPFIQNEHSYIEIQTGNIILNATIHGIETSNIDTLECYENKKYNITTNNPICHIANSNIIYILYEKDFNLLIYDNSVLLDFTREHINEYCCKINLDVSNCLLKIITSYNQTINIVYKHTRERARVRANGIDISMPNDMCIKIKQIMSLKLDYTICPITQDEIEYRERYYKCKRCNNIFAFNTMNHWLKTDKSCPICKISWPNADTVYINTDEPFIHKFVLTDINKIIKLLCKENGF